MDSKFITATRVFTYNVESIISDIQSGDSEMEVSDEEIMDIVDQWIEDDMRSPISRHELIVKDENGEDL